MSDKLHAILTELKTQMQELYGDRLVDLILYGSQARGDAVEGSDIDVLVVLKGEVNAGEEIDRSGGIIADISLEHSVVVSCVFMDEDRFIHRNGPLLRNVRREGIRL
jgi:predicted nucleotidyltransferase